MVLPDGVLPAVFQGEQAVVAAAVALTAVDVEFHQVVFVILGIQEDGDLPQVDPGGGETVPQHLVPLPHHHAQIPPGIVRARPGLIRLPRAAHPPHGDGLRHAVAVQVGADGQVGTVHQHGGGAVPVEGKLRPAACGGVVIVVLRRRQQLGGVAGGLHRLPVGEVLGVQLQLAHAGAPFRVLLEYHLAAVPGKLYRKRPVAAVEVAAECGRHDGGHRHRGAFLVRPPGTHARPACRKLVFRAQLRSLGLTGHKLAKENRVPLRIPDGVIHRLPVRLAPDPDKGLPVPGGLQGKGQVGRGQLHRIPSGGRVLRLPEGHHTGQGRHQHHRHRRPQELLGGLGDAGEPLLQAVLVPRHGGGTAQQVHRTRLGGDQRQQGIAVGQPLPVAQPLERALIAGQLAVPPAQPHRQPHQRVPPVGRQRGAPQDTPDMVALAEVGVLVGDDVAEHGRVGGTLRRHIDSGPQYSEQAGGGQAHRRVNRKGAVRRQGEAHPPQSAGKPQVGPGQPQGDHAAPRQPHPAQQGQPAGGIAEVGGFRSFRNLGRIGYFRRGRGRQHVPRSLVIGHRDVLPRPHGDGGGLEAGGGSGGLRYAVLHPLFRHHPHPGDGGSKELHRHQQPHQHHQPQGVPQPRAHPPAEGRPQAKHCQDQK